MLEDPSSANEDACDRNRRRRIRAFVTAAILAGVFFRFYAIDRQLYWNDEVYTSLRIAGYHVEEIEDELVDQPLVRVADMQKFQVPGPQKTVRDTVQGLADEEPQHPPLYFVLARQWVKFFGTSIAVSRSLSVFLSLLALPCVYWLCWELFRSSDVGMIATALVAVSPAHVVFAQEARPYSMFVLMVLVSSIALLRAMRSNSFGSWVTYAVTVVVGLYVQVLFGLAAVGHTIYVFTITRFAICRRSICYVISSAAALTAFVPWILVIVTHSGPKGTEWTQTQQSLLACVTRWAGIVSRTFLDLGVGPADPLRVKLSVLPLVALILLLIAYSIYVLIRRTPMQQCLFVITLIASVALPLFVMDVVLGRRYGTTRYILPSILGIQLSVAYLLASKLRDSDMWPRRRVLWYSVGVILLLAGTVSCGIRSGRELWWNKVPDDYGDYPQIARIINQSERAVIYCYGGWKYTQMICHRLDPNVRLQLLSDNKVPQLSTELDEAFLFNSTEAERHDVEETYDVRVEQTQGALWKIVR